MTMAPVAATDTSRSIPTTRTLSARAALTRTGVPAMTAATIISASGHPLAPASREAANDATMAAPETTGTAHRRWIQCMTPPSRSVPSERSRTGDVARLRDGCDQGVDIGDGRIVADLDTRGGEVHLHRLHAGQSADALLDLAHARGAGEALGAQHGGGGGG